LLGRLIDQHNEAVSAQEIDQYLEALEEPKRTTLTQLRQTILDVLPEAEQGISYGLRPAGTGQVDTSGGGDDHSGRHIPARGGRRTVLVSNFGSGQVETVDTATIA
jgi:hypothetical protein